MLQNNSRFQFGAVHLQIENRLDTVQCTVYNISTNRTKTPVLLLLLIYTAIMIITLLQFLYPCGRQRFTKIILRGGGGMWSKIQRHQKNRFFFPINVPCFFKVNLLYLSTIRAVFHIRITFWMLMRIRILILFFTLIQIQIRILPFSLMHRYYLSV